MIDIPNKNIEYQDYDEIEGRIKDFNNYYKIGKDSSGNYDMYAIEVGQVNKPAIVLSSGVHGPEWWTIQYSLWVMEQLDKGNYLNDDFLRQLITNFRIIHIPMVNPHGVDNVTNIYAQFDDSSRLNVNGIDLNRDFHVSSQQETKNINKLLDEVRPIALLDMHMFQPLYPLSNEKNMILGMGKPEHSDYNFLDDWEGATGEAIHMWDNPPGEGTIYGVVSKNYNNYTPETLTYITELKRPAKVDGDLIEELFPKEIFKYGIMGMYLFLKTVVGYFNSNYTETVRKSTMHVIDLEGNEYTLQATSTNEGEIDGNQSFSATILATKANKLFLNDIQEMWHVVDHDDVEHNIIYAKREGKGDDLIVEITAIPLFFDTLDNDRIYERYDEHMTAELAFNRIFKDTGFGFVLNGSFSAVDWEGFGGGESKLETFERAIKRYKCEFRIVGRTVYLETLIGRDTQHQYRHRLNASNIVQEIDANEMWTYAKGFGDYEDSESESGEGGWENAKLTREYTSPLADIIGIRHAPPIKDGRVKVKSELDASLKTLVDDSLKISVSADVYDLQKQGYPIAQSELGDRVFLIDERIGLNDEVRVVAQSKTRNWKGEVIDVNLTFGSEGITKRHQAKIDTATKNITELLEGKLQLPYSVLDDAVKNATKALQDAQTQLVFSDNGILAIDKDDPNLVTLFNSAGVGVSDDGGATFGQALTGNGLNVDYVYTGSMLADRIAGGILAALNGNTVFNLNDGHLTMESTNFELGGGAKIKFDDPGNRMEYTEGNRKSGFGVGRSINDTLPFAFMGATGQDENLNPSDEAYFSGFIANTSKRETEDGIQNSVVGKRFHVRDKAVSFERAFLFKTDSDAYFSPINTGLFDYDLGRPNNRWNNTYLRSNPDVSSDRNIKTDITDISLEFARSFLSVESKRYKKKLSNADLNSGIRGGNPYEFGFIAQDVESILEDKDLRFESLISTAKDGGKSMQYGQIPAIHHVLLQDAFKRIVKLEEQLNG